MTHRLSILRPPPRTESTEPSEPRVTTMLASQAESVAVAEQVKAVLMQAQTSADDHVVQESTNEVMRARNAYDKASQSFIETGRALNALEDIAGKRGYQGLFDAGLLPFSTSLASKLRAIARMVDEGTVPITNLPRALSTAYLTTTLMPEEVKQLVSEGVLRVDTTHDELAKRKATIRATDHLTPEDRHKLQKKVAEIRRKVTKLENEARMIEERLAVAREQKEA